MFIIRIIGLYSDELKQGAAQHIADILRIDADQAMRAANGDDLLGSTEDVAQLLTLLPAHVKGVTISARHMTTPAPIGLACARQVVTYRRALEDARLCANNLRGRLTAATAAKVQSVLVTHGD